MCCVMMNRLVDKNARIFVAGGNGLVGSAVIRQLEKQGYTNILSPSHGKLELMDRVAVEKFFRTHCPEYVVLAAARVGGIHANNTYPAEFIYQNLMIQNHVIHESWRHNVSRLIFLGSSCMYPKLCPQPMREEDLMTGLLEPTNSPYAMAKITGVEMCRSYNRQYGTSYISVIPTNLYGPNDNFDLETSHVLPALIRKFHEAKMSDSPSVVVWGTGSPKREFLHVNDLADACILLLNSGLKAIHKDSMIFNIGSGMEISIGELAGLIKSIVGYEGTIIFDPSKPDGTPRKLVDSSRVNAMGWHSKIQLADGIIKTYEWFLNNNIGKR